LCVAILVTGDDQLQGKDTTMPPAGSLAADRDAADSVTPS
jgi:hypothetical protein